jgi:hypothetical protein
MLAARQQQPWRMSIPYSVRKLFTGFATAALIAWKLMVTNAMNNAINAVITNTTQLMCVR